MRQTGTVAEHDPSPQAKARTRDRAVRVSWAVLTVPDEHPKAKAWTPRTLILERAAGSHYRPVVKLIAVMLARHMGSGKDDCFPGLDVIARESGCSERTASEVLEYSGICDTDVPSDPAACRYYPAPWFYRRRRRGKHGFHWHYFLIRSQAGYLATRGNRLTKRREQAKQRRMTEQDKHRLSERAAQNRAAKLAAKVIVGEFSEAPQAATPTPAPAQAAPPVPVNGTQVRRREHPCPDCGRLVREAFGMRFDWPETTLHACPGRPTPATPEPEPDPITA